MKLLNAKCVDFGGDFCPCILAEMGSCPVCGQLQGKSFCDCGASHGICVKEELQRNGGKAKPPRPTIKCKVLTVCQEGNALFIRVNVPHELECQLKRPGGFVFVRVDDNPLFDMPISVQYEENFVGSIALSIIPTGVKSRRLSNVKEGDEIWLRGPYFNGLLGQREIMRCKNEKCLVLAKGIAMMPSISVIQYLMQEGNNVEIVLDRTNFDNDILSVNLSLFELEPELCPMTNAEGLTPAIRQRIFKALDNGVRLIHIGASDYVIHLITEFLRQLGREDVMLTCCNNAKMCCGDAICGACTQMTPERKVIHYCKEQVNIWKI